MNNTINATMDTVATSTADFIDFDLIKADLTDVLNYVKETKPENLDKEALKTLRDNLSQLETILTNAIGDKPKAKKAEKKATTKKVEVETFDSDEGKKFYDSLNIGDIFQYTMANGTIITAKKIETKSKSGLSAACEVVSGLEIAEGKTAKRYPKFNKLVKVQNVKNPVQNTEKPVEETAKTDEVKQPITEEIKQAASVETNFNDTEDDDDLLNFDINDLDKDFDIE